MLVSHFKYFYSEFQLFITSVVLPTSELSTYNALKSFEMFYGSYFSEEREMMMMTIFDS